MSMYTNVQIQDAKIFLWCEDTYYLVGRLRPETPQKTVVYLPLRDSLPGVPPDSGLLFRLCDGHYADYYQQDTTRILPRKAVTLDSTTASPNEYHCSIDRFSSAGYPTKTIHLADQVTHGVTQNYPAPQHLWSIPAARFVKLTLPHPTSEWIQVSISISSPVIYQSFLRYVEKAGKLLTEKGILCS